METPDKQPELNGVVDSFYESWICEKLLDMSRIIYASDSKSKYPTGAEVMAMKQGSSPELIRLQMLENIDFLNVSLKYLMFDREALKRERDTFKKEVLRLKGGK